MPTDIATELYDSDVKRIMAVHMILKERHQGGSSNYSAFENEARERFGAIGFTVGISWFEYEIEGVPQEGAMPEITITGRIPGAFTFDHDQQVHEATSGLLGIPGEEGVIKTDKETVRRFLDDQGPGHSH